MQSLKDAHGLWKGKVKVMEGMRVKIIAESGG